MKNGVDNLKVNKKDIYVIFYIFAPKKQGHMCVVRQAPGAGFYILFD